MITARGEWVLLSAHLPGRAPEPIGILLCDIECDKLYLKLRPGWWCGLAEGEEAEIYDGLGAELERQACEMGIAQTLEFLSSASHTLRIGGRQSIRLMDFEVALQTLYDRWIRGHRLSFPWLLAIVKRRFGSIRATKKVRTVAFGKRPNVRALTGICAAGISAAILVSDVCRLPSRPVTPATIMINHAPYSWLPVLSIYRLDVEDIQMKTVSPQHYRKRLVARRRKRLQLDHLTAQVRVPVQMLPHSPPQYAVDPTPPVLTALTIISPTLPQLPPFHNKHNRFVRTVLAIISPLKVQGSTSERPGPKVI